MEPGDQVTVSAELFRQMLTDLGFSQRNTFDESPVRP